MNITLCSAFRNASSYIGRYCDQTYALHRALKERGDTLHLILGEGDSTDDTAQALRSFFNGNAPVAFVDVTHGGKVYGSVVDAQRFKQLAFVANKIWKCIPEDSAVAIWCESDLIWSADVMIALIDRLKEYPCVAPMVMEQSSGGFYDIFCFRKDGKHFNKHEPYFDGWPTSAMVKVDSAGSVLAMNAEIARRLTWPEESVIVGLCENIYRLGESVWLDANLSIFHS